VLGNDSDADGDAKTAILVTGPANAASFTLNADGSFNYTPNANYNGGDSFTYKANDGTADSNVAMINITIAAVNDAPVSAGQSVTTNEDTATTITLSASDVDSASLTFQTQPGGPTRGTLGAISAPTCAPSGAGSACTATVTYTPAANSYGADSFHFAARDASAQGNAATVSITVTSVNDSPSGVTVSVATSPINEGDTAAIAVTFQDPDAGDAHVAVINWGDGSSPSTVNLAAGVFGLTAAHAYLDDNPTGTPQDVNTITVTVTDGCASGCGASGLGSAGLTVRNLAPVVTSVTGPLSPIAEGGLSTVSATFTDAGSQDAHACAFAWGDTTTSAGTVTETAGNGTCTASHTYAEAGVYTVTVSVTDDDTGTSTAVHQYVVIYDASAGFVTGGGWITSPAGAMPANPAATGKANYGFNSKYANGKTVPDGNTEFQFNAGNLNFKSTSYEWLVISGGFKAQYKGHGTINGVAGYGFILTAVDGTQQGSGGADKFRIKIYNENQGNGVVYDNNIGASDNDTPTTTPGGGNIVIHK
jgi:VCBS repeat-containing protein